MNVKTNAQGKDRKNLVKAIAEITRQEAKYNGAPAFTYTVGNESGKSVYDGRGILLI